MGTISGSVGRGGRNLPGDVAVVQRLLNRRLLSPLQSLVVDGVAGPKTIRAIEEFQRRVARMVSPDGRVDPNGHTLRALVGPGTSSSPKGSDAAGDDSPEIAWGATVSAEFKRKVIAICKDLGMDPNYLMACMKFESGLDPARQNATSGATGLIQFMDSTAKALGTTTDQLAGMTAERQLDYVAKYFAPYRERLTTLEDVYMAILCPAAIGKPIDTTLYDKDGLSGVGDGRLDKHGKKTATPKRYEQNKGLDKDHDGKISKFEAAAAVRTRLTQGLQPGNKG